MATTTGCSITFVPIDAGFRTDKLSLKPRISILQNQSKKEVGKLTRFDVASVYPIAMCDGRQLTTTAMCGYPYPVRNSCEVGMVYYSLQFL